MKHNLKRIFSAICALAMCAAMVPLAAFAEEPADSGILSPGSSAIYVGEEAVLQGTSSEEGGHKWTVNANGGYDASGLQIVSSQDTETVTVSALKPGVYSVRHSWNTGLSWPMSTDSELFTLTVSAHSITVNDLEIYSEVEGIPYDQGQEVTLSYTLHYRGTSAPTSGGNFDSVFAPISMQATFNGSNGTRVKLTAANSGDAGKELMTGYYRLDYDNTDSYAVWDEAGTRKEESVYFQVTEDKTIKIVSSGGNAITSSYADYSTITLQTAENVSVVTFDTAGGTSLMDALCVSGSALTLPDTQRDGYTLTGWQDAAGTQYKAGDAYTVNGDTTLTASWAEAEEPSTEPEEPGTDPEQPPVTDPVDPTVPGDSVELDKTATDLVDDKTDVTLTVGGGQEITVSDVVFVLDKSASLDIRQEAMNMLSELMEQAKAGNVIKVGVVNFETGVLESLPLTELNDDNYIIIQDSVAYINDKSTGTNIEAGLAAGAAMLDADTEVADANKHLVLVTDGVGYLWGTEDTGAYSIYSENISNGEENLYASHETIDWHHADSASYYAEFEDMLGWYNRYAASIAEDMETYQIAYESGQYTASAYGVPHGQGEDTDWSLIDKFAAENSYVPAELESETASAADAAIYMVARQWIQIAQKYNAYAYADPRYYNSGRYAWAYNAISNLGDLGDYSGAIPATAAEYDGMFDAVKSSVLYAIESGTVTDVIGADFDLDSVDSFELTVGGVAASKEVDGNTVTFNGGDYVVTYYPAESGQDEYFTWDINVPVEDTNTLRLTYTLQLVNKATQPGDYTVATNEEATLEYTPTTGGSDTETFPVPEVTYTVEDTTVTPPDTGDEGGNGNEGGNGDTGAGTNPGDTNKPGTSGNGSTDTPKTGDSAPVTLVVAAMAAAVAAFGLLMMQSKKRAQCAGKRLRDEDK